jgi:DegV family protein with EDD domain
MTDYKIIADSGCDLTEEMKSELNADDTIPFYINFPAWSIHPEESVIDDHTLKIPTLLQKMRHCTEKITTSCPPPQSFKDAFAKAGHGFAVTISAKLSGCYESACIGLQMAREENGAVGYVFDSMSASCGEVLVAYKIRELVQKDVSFQSIIDQVNHFIQNMKTFFVLDDVSNLVRNGRMNKITGTLVNVLGIKPVLSSRDGEIAMLGKVRGAKAVADKLLDAVAECGRVINKDALFISHCENLPLAEELREKAKKRFNFGKIKIIEMKGLSSFYASERGVIMSF